MATIKRPAKRTTPRVTETESGGHGRAAKQADHRGSATVLSNGNIEIAVQLSELVPVAQYANVTLGPVQLRWQIDNPGIEKLGTVDWDNMDDMSAEQRAIYDTVRGYLRGTSKVIEHSIAEDRELVEESVRLHNEREAEAEEAKAKKPARRRR